MEDLPRLGGWHNDPAEVQNVLATLPDPEFFAAAPHLLGKGEGKTVLLYKAFKDVNNGQYIDYPRQTIGDCVSQGTGHGIDLLAAVEIALGHERETFKQTCTEAVYGFSRVDIGGGRLRGDGSVGAWAAKAVNTIGTVSRDVTGPYDGNRARQWGSRGVPPEIKSQAAEHRVGTVSLVQTYDELEDALAAGYPVTVCSNQGFTMQRDAFGFCRPSGHWAHCMLIVGIRNDERPGACIFQSWGSDVPSGPLSLDQPPNSFWADRDTVSHMLAAQDSWALSMFDGYPDRRLPDKWTWDGFAAP